ncbi:MAG: fumarylacetoacetate hydrolase family protein [Candidatus Ranarchaeia archaeon]
MVETRLAQMQDPVRGCRLCQIEGPFPNSKEEPSRSTRIIDLTSCDPSVFKNFMSLLVESRDTEKSISELVQGAVDSSEHPYLYRPNVLQNSPSSSKPYLLPPVIPSEVWGAGVTYKRSREAREVETQSKGIYDKVYDAVRPEVYFKTTGLRVVGPYAFAGIRKDSNWSVPEPELTLILGYGDPPDIVGVTIGNDMSARDIEGENPLYLPQAKIFKGCCVLGPYIVPVDEIPDLYDLRIHMAIKRNDKIVFENSTSTKQLKRKFEELVEYLARSNIVPPGTAFVTGTGIVPPDDFSLKEGDIIKITIEELGFLENPVRRV